ncbi:MAG: hypothetical protein R2708_05295 [Vicinamibacterales bacterium]
MTTFHASAALRRPALAALALACAASAGAFAEQKTYRPLTNARWEVPTNAGNLDVQFSADLKTRTDRLPAVSQITANRTARVQVQYGNGDAYGQAAVERVTPSGAQVTCPTTTTPQMSFTCVANMQWLRTLTADTTVRLRAKTVTNQVHYVDWTFIAPPNLVFLNQINGPSSVIKGNVAEFTLVLAAPAPGAGVTVTYQAEPAACFSAGATRVNTSSGTVQFSANQQYRTLTLSTANCSSGNAMIKTWTHEQRDQSPYYRTKTFTLLPPRG